MSEKINIFGKTIEEIEEICFAESFPKFTAKQISEWLYKKRVLSFDKMSNLSLTQRQKLDEKYEIAISKPISEKVSKDGTKKYLFPIFEGQYVETVFIPDKNRATVCISTQTGCLLSCSFCETAKSKKANNLSAGELLSQVLFLPEYDKLTNIVVMGMGEPFLNLQNLKTFIEIISSEKYIGISKRRITVSTVGIIPQLKEFLQIFPCELAISLHNPFHEQRKQIMPIENKYPIAEVLYLIRRYTVGSKRLVSFEYIVFKDFNDTEQHVEELSNILKDIPCKINLITFNPIDGFSMQSPEIQEVERFQNLLKDKGFTVTIRKSRGRDIEAACGLLSSKSAE